MRKTAEYTRTYYKTNTEFCKGIKNNTNFFKNYWNTRETGYNM